MQNTAKFWDDVAEKYAKSPIKDMEAYDFTLERTLSYLKKTDHVLELGGGTGTTAIRLAPHVKQYTGSDISSAMTEVAKRKQGDATILIFIVGDVQEAINAADDYDAVLAFNLLHLLKDLDGALKAIHGSLKPGDLFISKTISNPGRNAPLKLRLMKMILPLMQLVGKAPYVNFMSITDLESRIEAAGFKILETGNYPARPPNRFIVAERI